MNLLMNVALWSSIASMLLLLSGEATALKPFPSILQSAVAQVPEDGVTVDLLERYAKVVLAIEPYRVETAEASNNAEDESEQNEIRRQFIQKATEIIEANGMAVADYNRITIQLRQDEDLKARIEAAIRSHQQDGASLQRVTNE